MKVTYIELCFAEWEFVCLVTANCTPAAPCFSAVEMFCLQVQQHLERDHLSTAATSTVNKCGYRKIICCTICGRKLRQRIVSIDLCPLDFRASQISNVHVWVNSRRALETVPVTVRVDVHLLGHRAGL